MLIENTSKYLLKKTRAKAKMIEYNVPINDHIEVEEAVVDLFLIAVAAIGNVSSAILRDEENKESIMKNYKYELEFSSKYFDAFLNSQLDEGGDEYYLLLGSVAYFLCDYVGSSKVLAKKINVSSLDLSASGLENCLASLLNDKFEDFVILNKNNEYFFHLQSMQEQFNKYFTSGKRDHFSTIKDLRKAVYEHGSNLELLLVDAFCAIYKLKFENSAIHLLPKYTGLPLDKLADTVFKGKLIKEMWPAQKILGEKEIFAGKSAVIQMPTSSGKTKSISIAIISAFLSGRTDLAVIIAPFRALCREISLDLEKDFQYDGNIKIDQLSELLQPEHLEIDAFDEGGKVILVATPEKLIYLLRQRPELIDRIGLAVFDEGHLFDEPNRGITYELLISTIKNLISQAAQKILVSAIIQNVSELNDWLNGEDGVAVTGDSIKSTQKTVAFTDWHKIKNNYLGYLYFVDPENPNEEEFYVPRLIRINQINKLERERNDRFFPEVNFVKKKVAHNDISIYFGINLCSNGGVVIFCGKKDIANNILKRILDIGARGYPIDKIRNIASKDEVSKICNLIKLNYGEDNIYFLAAMRSVFVHHAGISNGIKISIENAMRNDNISFLICTSTLAQGVNLPIKYLIISNLYRGKDKIRVRDFQNLMGRAGRSGLYTEGTILLAETFIYNKKGILHSDAQKRWNEYVRFIDNANSEACSSGILKLVRKHIIQFRYEMPLDQIVLLYYSDKESYEETLEKEYKRHPEWIADIKLAIGQTMATLEIVESFLMGYLLDEMSEVCFEKIDTIVKNTLAYFLANDEEKQKLIELFESIGKYCVQKVDNPSERCIYSRSLLGVNKMLVLQEEIEKHYKQLISCEDSDSLYELVFPIALDVLESPVIKNLENINSIIEIGKMWSCGDSYKNIFDYARIKVFKIKSRRKYVELNLDDIIKICDNVISYDSTVVVSAISEIVSAKAGSEHKVLSLLKELLARLKYGLKDLPSVLIYEIGFSDREVAKRIVTYLNEKAILGTKVDAIINLKKYRDDIGKILNFYPNVFIERLNTIN